MWMLAGLMLAGITACSDADSELGTVASQSEGKTRAYDYSCTLTVEEPGTLGTLLEQQMGEDAGNVQELIVSGVYSSTDAEYVRDKLRNTLVRIDLSGVTQFLEKNEYYDYENGYWTYDWVDNHRLFYNCFYNVYKLEEVILPENIITEIGSSSFSNCSSLTQVTIPEGVTTIQNYALASCDSLRSVSIPSSVTSLGNSVFYRDTALESLEILADISEIPSSLCEGCSKLQELKFPASVHSIGDRAFRYCYLLNDFTLFDGIDSFGEYCFSSCGFEEVDLSNLSVIASRMFSGCSSLKNVTFSSNLKEIKEFAFEACGLQSLSLPNGIETLGNYCFRGCGDLEEVDISNLATISFGMFSDCSALKNVTLSSELTEIPSYAFSGTAIRTITLPNSLRTIGNEAFYKSQLEEVELPSGLTTIDSYAFEQTQLRTITIPENIKSKGGSIFSGCKRLTAIYWDTSMDATSLGLDSYTNCILYLHTFNGIAPAFDTDITNVVIDDVAETIVLRSKSAYDFNCSRSFTAKKISYTFYFDTYYTYPGQVRNWYTITLPFKPTKISHPTKGQLAPFNSDVEDAKPFWLRELNGNDFENVTAIEPNHPYIISMPYNPDLYLDEYNISGNVTFEAENVEIGVTPELTASEGTDFSMWPNYSYKEESEDYYGLTTDCYDNSIGRYVCVFRTGERIYPFQAYVTSATARSIISMDGKRAATRVASDDPRLKHPGKPRIDDI
jgi:hypothetical protein